MNRFFTFLILICSACLFVFCSPENVRSDNNIEFLGKNLIKSLNSGIYEIVKPKSENNQIQYARELPFDKLSFKERNEKYYSIGTAFFINKKELMTAAHVFQLEYFSLLQDFYIRDPQGKVYPVNMIKKYSNLRDMVVFDLKKYPDKITPLKLGKNAEIGDTVFSVGNAQGEGLAYRAGQIASFTPEKEYGKWKDIRFSSPASPGNSGGPLLDLKGNVLGIIVKKNQSENYNIAVPINESDNLTGKAEFHIRNVLAGIYGVNDTLTRDWIFGIQLPLSVKNLAEHAQDSFNAHITKLSNDLSEKVKLKNYPKGERFRDFLRDQPIKKGLGLLIPGQDFKTWNINGWYGEKIPITASQNVYKARGVFNALNVIIEKPAEMSLKKFINSPKIVMDNLLKAVPFLRHVGREKIPITSFGAPDQTKIIKDKMGRKWTTATWNLPHDDMFVYCSFLPYPKGVICLLDSRMSSSRKYGYFNAIQDALNEIITGYIGNIEDWQEYFNLEKKYLPDYFQKASLDFKNHNLNLKLKDFSLDFTNKKIKKNSSIHLHMGYSNKDLLAEDLLLFELYPVKGGNAHYRIQAFFEPSPLSSDKYKSKWNDIINATGDFSGKLINKGNKLIIKKPVKATKTNFVSIKGKKITKVFAVGAYYKTTDKKPVRDSKKFFKSIHFNKLP